jgi:hypothetical protein
MKKTNLKWAFLLFCCISAPLLVHSQDLGATFAWHYEEMYGGHAYQYNQSIAKRGLPNDTTKWWETTQWWENMAEEINYSGLDYIALLSRGNQPNAPDRGNGNPKHIPKMVTAMNLRGANFKLAIFDDCPNSWTGSKNWEESAGASYTTTDPKFDCAVVDNYKYIWDYNLKEAIGHIPDDKRYKIDGRMVIYFWSVKPVWMTNIQGNLTKILEHIKTKCFETYGIYPYFIIDKDWLDNDSTLLTSPLVDAVHNWFSAAGGKSATLYSWNDLKTNTIRKTGVCVPGFSSDDDIDGRPFLDPSMGTTNPKDNGARLKYGLNTTVKSGASVTLIEGFSDAAETAALWRSSDEGLLKYYDYPNQRLNIVRSYTQNPFPTSLKMEAEACDFHFDTTTGNSGGAFLDRGNLDVLKSSDLGGGWFVTNTQPNEWMEWKELPLLQSTKFKLRYKSTAASSIKFSVDGTDLTTINLASTGGTWTTIDAGTYSNTENGAHDVKLTIVSGTPDINYFIREQNTNEPIIPSDPIADDVAANGDYRSLATGNWNGTTTWQTRVNGSWQNTATPPNSNNNVFIQAGHTVTVDAATVACYSLHLNTLGVLAIGSGNTVEVNGKIRCFTGTAVTGTTDDTYLGTDSTSTTNTMFSPNTSAATLKFVGNARALNFAGEWNITNISVRGEFALNSNQIGTAAAGFRFNPLVFSSGIVSTTSAITCNGPSTIKNGAKLISSRSGNSPVVNGTTSTFTIENGGVLEVTGAIPNLAVVTFTNNGTIVYSRAGSQSALASNTTGTTPYLNYNNLIVNNGTTVTIPATFTITATGLITNNGTITNNGSLVLQSNASGTASLVGNSVANVTQERYLSSNQRGWRLLSNPLSSTTFAALASGSNLTLGANYTGEYLSASNTWTSTDGTVAMNSQKAYKVFITGQAGEAPNYTTGPTNVTIKVTGTAANTVPTAITTTASQYYLVANPYTAPVSIASIIAASTGLSNSVSYYDPTKAATNVKVKAGGYNVYTISGVAGSATDIVLPPMGSIFVQASTNGTINIPKSVIFTGTPAQSGSFNHKSAQKQIATSNTLKVEVFSEGVNYDSTELQFRTLGEASNNIDFGKLPNSFLDVYTIADSQKRAISELELKEQTIVLGVKSTLQKSFTLRVAENTIPVGFEAVLIDNLLKTATMMTKGASYDFTIDANPSSQGDARFEIQFKTASNLATLSNELDSKIRVWPNPSRGQFNISNLATEGKTSIEVSAINGQIILHQEINANGTTTVPTKDWAKGVYFLKVSNNGKQTTKKLIIP